MGKPWVRALLVFVVAVIGFQSLTGLAWIFSASDKLVEILFWLGFLVPVSLAWWEHDRCLNDPMFMSRDKQRERLRRIRDTYRHPGEPP